jgi:hypothetical protein|tara:strand:- start:256 stop:522 length:267 start_codon:yes stop_codon:yes gene_type:complete
MGGVARKILPKPPAVVAPTTAEVSQATSTVMSRPEDMPNDMSGRKAEDMSNAEISVANKKKGRSLTILQKAKGLGDTNLNTTKKTLGA